MTGVDQNIPCHLTKYIVVPSTALLYPAYKNNNQTCGGLGWPCVTRMYHFKGHVEFLKFPTRIFIEWESAPKYTVENLIIIDTV